jgi:hypothetical protein
MLIALLRAALVTRNADLAAVYPSSSLFRVNRLPVGKSKTRGVAATRFAYHLGLPGSDLSWTEPFPQRPPATFIDGLRAELAWARNHLLPWVGRHLQGKSSGDGRVAKRPELLPVSTAASPAEPLTEPLSQPLSGPLSQQ